MNARIQQALETLGLGDLSSWRAADGQPSIPIRSAIDGSILASIRCSTPSNASAADLRAELTFRFWREDPAPTRGEFVRRLGLKFRELKPALADLITFEVGKITQEALGEVQEVIDICDFAVGLSRQLHGLTIASERSKHRLMEQWHPLGPVLVITAFNFPMAVWAWNAALAWVCGNPVIWKPSEKTSLCAIACQAVVESVKKEMGIDPLCRISQLVIGDRTVGDPSCYPRVRLISATGSVKMGKAVQQAAGLRRTLLELGGNNGMIVTPSADLDLAVRAIVFGAVGTCGQRCTTLRRLFIHASRYDELMTRLKAAYEKLPIGDPSQPGILVGPLIDEAARKEMRDALREAKVEGGVVHFGHRVKTGVPAGGTYVHPALVEMPPYRLRNDRSVFSTTHESGVNENGEEWESISTGLHSPRSTVTVVEHETFAPILYVMKYEHLNDVIEAHNDVPQGLSSAIITNDIREAELFMSAAGSDCGLVNVNCGTSGAEIGGAFGGEKETGGGRESGSDSWKNYMRRVTSTINFSGELPLAQGIQFDL